MRSIDDIVSLHASRLKDTQAERQEQQLFRDYISDKLPVPLPELDKEERSAIANLAKTGLEQLALRVGSTLPEVIFPALREGIKASEDKARNRKKALLGFWDRNDMQAVLTLRAEYLFADASAPVTVLPDPHSGVPTWRVRDTMTYLPAPSHDPLNIVPDDCLTGDTEFITKEHGVVPLAEMVDQTVTVLTRDGWAKGEVRHFGRREVQRITFGPANRTRGEGATFAAARSNHRVVVSATPRHRWPLVDGSITRELAVGDVVHAVASQDTEDLAAYDDGFRHGLIFGDGSASWTYANGDRDHRLQLCGAKQRFTAYFERVTYPPSADGDPVCFLRVTENLKELPSGKPVDYLRGFVDGWVATDGCDLHNGTFRIASQHPQAGEWLVRHAAMAGWVVRGWNITPIGETSYGWRSAPLHNIALVRQDSAAGWKVLSIESLPESVDLYCAVVPGPETFALASGVYSGNCIFTFQQTWASLKKTYGGRVDGLRRHRETRPDSKFTVLEYLDDMEIVTIALPGSGDYDMVGVETPMELDRINNRAECPLTFAPGLTSIIGRKGKLNGTIGVHQMRAKLLALAYITTRRGAFPDPWVEPIDNASTPDFTAIPNHRTGTPGVIKGGRLRYIEPNPGFMTSPMLSILEREGRLAAGLPAELGGESASSVRTARRGDQLISSAIDFPIQRAQMVLAKSMECENKAAIAIAKKWTPGARSFYVNWRGAKGWAEYDPNVDFETDEHTVRWMYAGSDLNDATIRHAQLVGTGQMSKQTARRMNPELEDGDQEGDIIAAEQATDAFWASVTTKINDPASRWGPREVAKLDRLLHTDKKSLFDAVAQIEEDLAAEQAAAAPLPDAVPGMPGAPLPAEIAPAIPPVGEGLQNLSSQLRAQFPINAAQGLAS